MAATWRSVSLAIAYASGKSMLDIFQASGGTRVHRVKRMFHFNNGTGAVAGVLTQMRIERIITSISGGSTVTPIAHDTNSSALNANTTSGTNRTVTRSDIFRQYIYCNDEPAASGATMDEWELFVPFATVWEAGYGDTDIQPIVCRGAQGAHMVQQGTSAVGTCDMEIEFTDEAS
jgi:hypothetical protein